MKRVDPGGTHYRVEYLCLSCGVDFRSEPIALDLSRWPTGLREAFQAADPPRILECGSREFGDCPECRRNGKARLMQARFDRMLAECRALDQRLREQGR